MARSRIRQILVKREYLLVFLCVVAIEIAVGFNSWYFNPTDITPYPSDAFSRVANAFYVLYCDPPSLANIGAVWNPLPSLLEIPVVWFSRFWQPLASYALAGVIVCSLFAGGTAALLLHAFKKFAGLSSPWAYLFTALYVFNPFIFYYGYNGMSETFSYFFVVLTIYMLMWWMRTGAPSFVSLMGFSLMGLFLVRYEAIPFAIGIWLAMMVFIWRSERESKYVLGGRWEKLHYCEATSVILVLPLVFIIIVWILYNAVIMGDPLYFLHSAYSNSAQAQYAAQYASFGELVSDIAPKIVPFMIVYAFILFLRACTRRFFRIETLIVTLLVGSLLAFHILLLLSGGSYGWLRFYSYALPISVVWLGYELYLVGSRTKLWRVGGVIALAVSLLLCNNALYKYDYNDLNSIDQLKEIASYIKEDIEPETLLTDSFTTWGILLQMKDLDSIVTSCSPTFDESVEDPARMGIKYVLVPSDKGVNASDALLTKWPDLGKGKEVEGFTLVKEFPVTYSGVDSFYLYKVDY